MQEDVKPVDKLKEDIQSGSDKGPYWVDGVCSKYTKSTEIQKQDLKQRQVLLNSIKDRNDTGYSN